MNVKLTRNKIEYKGKEYWNYYLLLPNGVKLSININSLLSDKVTKDTKRNIITMLELVAEYEKE